MSHNESCFKDHMNEYHGHDNEKSFTHDFDKNEFIRNPIINSNYNEVKVDDSDKSESIHIDNLNENEVMD